MNDRIINNNRLVEEYLYALKSLLYAIEEKSNLKWNRYQKIHKI